MSFLPALNIVDNLFSVRVSNLKFHAVLLDHRYCTCVEMSDYESDEEPTAADETVLNKYKLAGEICNCMFALRYSFFFKVY